MTDLLKTIPMKIGSKNPLMVEFPVNPETSPYLVTAAGRSKLIWVPKSSGKVRVGVRYGDDRDSINTTITREIALVGQQSDWGNVHPLTQSGFQEALQHLADYGFEDVEILSGSEDLPFLTDLTVTKCDWLGKDCALVLPKDRAFVGVISSVGEGYAVLVHNPSRGVAIMGEP